MKQILIAEDEEILVNVLKDRFESAGWNVVVAVNGEEATQAINGNTFDLVLLDLLMPKKNGFLVLKEVRNDPKFKALPVIVLSNLGGEDDIEKALALGANDYFIKTQHRLSEIVEKAERYKKFPNLIHKIQDIPKNKSVFIFDLDGTLSHSKTKADPEMGLLLTRLLTKYKAAIITGGLFEQLKSQLPDNILTNAPVLDNLNLLPLNGGSFYVHQNNSWQKLYAQELTVEEKKKIFDSFEMVFKDIGFVRPAKIYGELIEDRIGEVAFSGLGQDAPLADREKWAVEMKDERLKLVSKLKEYLPDMAVEVAGLSSIDVTKKGIDKKFGIEQIVKHLNVSVQDVIFFGDALRPEGNDYPALESGALCYKVDTIEDTKKALKYILD